MAYQSPILTRAFKKAVLMITGHTMKLRNVKLYVVILNLNQSSFQKCTNHVEAFKAEGEQNCRGYVVTKATSMLVPAW